jgi:hypothetical protein
MHPEPSSAGKASAKSLGGTHADPMPFPARSVTSLDDECKQIIDLCKETGLKYMMIETVVYAREFLFMKELHDKGEFGKVLFLKASHRQRLWRL